MTPRPSLVLVATAVTVAMLLATMAVGPESLLWKLVLISIAVGLPGALGAALQPHNAVGWLLLVVGLLFACLSLTTQVIASGQAGAWASWFADRAGAIVVPLTLLALLLLPDGRLPSPRWRPATATVITGQVAVVVVWCLVSGAPGSPNPLGVLPAAWGPAVDNVGDWLLQLPFVLVVAAVVVRLRAKEDRGRLAALLGAAAGFAILAVAGHVVWPGLSDLTDVLGATMLGAGLTMTLLHRPPPVGIDWSAVGTPELSAREREVLELVAEGLTNPEIAQRLSISPVTARNHVSRILTKLDLDNRTQAATWLSRGGGSGLPRRTTEPS